MALTNQQILDELNEIWSKYLTSREFMKKTITTPEGSTIEFRSPSELIKIIDMFQDRVNRETNSSDFITRLYYYV